MSIYRAVLLAAALGPALGCNNAGFNADSDKNSAAGETAHPHCDPQGKYAADQTTIVVKNSADARLTVDGDFCPETPAELKVLFLVDISRSMYNSAAKSSEDIGNDPLKNGTCGRLEAGRALLELLAQQVKQKKTSVRAAVVNFASSVVQSVPFTEITDASGLATVGNFCRDVGQVNYKTNYKVALEQATAMLAKETGTKIVYLISDGLPTVGGQADDGLLPEHQTAALLAAKGLRDTVKDVILNTLFLGDIASIKAKDNVDPMTFLHQLTGDPSRVKIAANGSELQGQILQLAPPAIELDKAKAKAFIEPGSGLTYPVRLVEFQPTKRSNIWHFVTEPFVPFAPPSGELDRILTIQAEDSRGAQYEVKFKLSRKQN